MALRDSPRLKAVAVVPVVLALAAGAVVVQRITRPAASSQLLILLVIPDGPRAETLEIRTTLARQLADAFSPLPEVRIIQVTQQVAAPDGTAQARDLGRRYHAAIVIGESAGFGMAGPSVFVEEMSPAIAVPFLSVKDYMTASVLVEPRSLRFPDPTAEQGRRLVEFVRGAIDHRRADYAHALEHLTAALDESSSSDVRSKVLLSRGNALLALGKSAAAIEDYSRAIQINPDLQDAYANRGAAFLKLAAHERAAEDFAGAIQFERYTQVNQAALDVAQGRDEAARAVYDRLLRAHPDDEPAYLNRGVSWAVVGDHRRAVDDFSRALQLQPMDAMAYYDRGLSLAAQDKLQRAIEDYTAALRISPQNAAAHYARGVAQAALGHYAQAVEDLTRAVQIDPAFAAAYRDRGASHLLLGRLDRAIADATTAVTLDPHDANAYFNRGLSYTLRGEAQKAIADMQKVLEVTKEPALRKKAQEQLDQLRKEQ
ncbi:MAG TPA: tetratricopeptide repeat protein [bacterium]|nr:tetratricopeptide repeat protein [bacterium]